MDEEFKAVLDFDKPSKYTFKERKKRNIMTTVSLLFVWLVFAYVDDSRMPVNSNLNDPIIIFGMILIIIILLSDRAILMGQRRILRKRLKENNIEHRISNNEIADEIGVTRELPDFSKFGAFNRRY